MSYTSEQIKNLLQQGESQTVEFERQIEVQCLAKLIAAFANTEWRSNVVGRRFLFVQRYMT